MLLLCIKTTSSAAKPAMVISSGEHENAAAAAGRQSDAVTEPRETLRLNTATHRNTAMTPKNTCHPQASASAAPTETPFPPLKPKYSGKQ